MLRSLCSVAHSFNSQDFLFWLFWMMIKKRNQQMLLLFAAVEFDPHSGLEWGHLRGWPREQYFETEDYFQSSRGRFKLV